MRFDWAASRKCWVIEWGTFVVFVVVLKFTLLSYWHLLATTFHTNDRVITPLPFNASGYAVYYQVQHSNISTFCPLSLFMCFVWIWEQTAIVSLYSINWLVFITETEYVYCAVRTGSLYTASLKFSNSTFCPHSVFMCFVWIWEQTAIISPYNINWLVFLTETECVYCAVRTGPLYTASLTFTNSTFFPQTAIISLFTQYF